MMPSPFNVTPHTLGTDQQLYIIDIEAIDNQLKEVIDNRIIKICEGSSTSNLQNVKSRLLSFLESKNSAIKMGAISEFIVHVFLNESGFHPQFLYFNLEENSIKKGFDGYYSKTNEEWILESKSGIITTANIGHAKKIRESYDDLKNKLAGNTSNNPWRNAYNHASHSDVDAIPDLKKNIKIFSDQFVSKVKHDIKNFNIIPGSTIFLDGTWKATDIPSLLLEVKILVKEFDFKKINIICITKKSLNIFESYLKIP